MSDFLSMEIVAAYCGLVDAKPKPIARLVPLTAPVGESEAEFWHRKARERSLEIAQLRRQIVCLKDAIAVYEEESS